MEQGMGGKLITITNIIMGAFLFFLAIILIRIFMPIVNMILGLFLGDGIAYATVQIIAGLVIVFLTFYVPWKVFFNRQEEERI